MPSKKLSPWDFLTDWRSRLSIVAHPSCLWWQLAGTAERKLKIQVLQTNWSQLISCSHSLQYVTSKWSQKHSLISSWNWKLNSLLLLSVFRDSALLYIHHKGAKWVSGWLHWWRTGAWGLFLTFLSLTLCAPETDETSNQSSYKSTTPASHIKLEKQHVISSFLHLFKPQGALMSVHVKLCYMLWSLAFIG